MNNSEKKMNSELPPCYVVVCPKCKLRTSLAECKLKDIRYKCGRCGTYRWIVSSRDLTFVDNLIFKGNEDLEKKVNES